MRRLLRMLRSLATLLFNLLTSFSLLSCIAVLALWADSQFTARRVSRHSDHLYISLISDSGKIAFDTTRANMPMKHGPAAWRYESGPARIWGGAHLMSNSYGRFGFGRVKQDFIATIKYTDTQTWLPHWSLVASSSICPAIWMLRRSQNISPYAAPASSASVLAATTISAPPLAAARMRPRPLITSTHVIAFIPPPAPAATWSVWLRLCWPGTGGQASPVSRQPTHPCTLRPFPSRN